MSDRKGHYLFLVAISVAVLFTNLGVPKLWDRDEPRNAGCAVEMKVLDSVPYFLKDEQLYVCRPSTDLARRRDPSQSTSRR